MIGYYGLKMSKFQRNLHLNDSIFIMGSYNPKYSYIIESLKDFLIRKGFINVYLASDIILKTDNEGKSSDQINYEKVELLLTKSDYNFFILADNTEFHYINDSVKTEIISFLKSHCFSEKSDKYLILLPFDLKLDSMLNGLFDKQQVNIYRYYNPEDINEKCLKFIQIP